MKLDLNLGVTAVVKKPLPQLEGKPGVRVKVGTDGGRTYVICQLRETGEVLKPDILNGIPVDYHVVMFTDKLSDDAVTGVIVQTKDGVKKLDPIFQGVREKKYCFENAIVLKVWKKGEVEAVHVGLSSYSGTLYLKKVPIFSVQLPRYTLEDPNPERLIGQYLPQEFQIFFKLILELYREARTRLPTDFTNSSSREVTSSNQSTQTRTSSTGGEKEDKRSSSSNPPSKQNPSKQNPSKQVPSKQKGA